MSRWDAVSDYDYEAEQYRHLSKTQLRVECSRCGWRFNVNKADGFVMHPLCQRCQDDAVEAQFKRQQRQERR